MYFQLIGGFLFSLTRRDPSRVQAQCGLLEFDSSVKVGFQFLKDLRREALRFALSRYRKVKVFVVYELHQ